MSISTSYPGMILIEMTQDPITSSPTSTPTTTPTDTPSRDDSWQVTTGQMFICGNLIMITKLSYNYIFK